MRKDRANVLNAKVLSNETAIDQKWVYRSAATSGMDTKPIAEFASVETIVKLSQRKMDTIKAQMARCADMLEVAKTN